MKKYYITEEELNSLHEMALEVNKNKSYREGYLDSYNRFKLYLKELINKPVETTNEQPKLTRKEYDFIIDALESYDEFIYPKDIIKKLERLIV